MIKKAMLIFPRPISEAPSGFAYLNAVLKSKGYEVKALVNTFKYYYTDEEILKEIETYKPNIVGFNLGTLQLLSTYKLIKKVPSSVTCILAGGPHATTCPEEVLNNGVDIVVRNEGEETLSELCDYLDQFDKDVLDKPFIDIKNVLGISYITAGGDIIHNLQRPYKDFSELPKPDYSCFDLEKFKTSDGVVKGLHRIYCSRGCPNKCTFCDSAIFGRRVRYRPLEDVIAEIKYRNKTYGMTSFVIADDTFTASKKYVREFCYAMQKENPDIIWSCSTRANTIEENLLKLMRESGCYLIAFGIESADETTLERIKKHITLKQAHDAVDLCYKLGYRIFVNLMTGFPWEDVKAVENNISYIKQHFNQAYVFQVSGGIVPYPGTEIYEEYKDILGKWWLKPSHQGYGQQIHQNSIEPYKVNTFYQRTLYDDTYIQEDKFFSYTKEYKKVVKKMAFLIGRRNLKNDYPNPIRRFFIYSLCKLSRFVYEVNKNVEKKVIGKIMEKHKSMFHDRMPLGAVSKKEAIK